MLAGGLALTAAAAGGKIESIEYLANVSSIRATIYSDLCREIQVEVYENINTGNNEMKKRPFTITIKKDGPARMAS